MKYKDVQKENKRRKAKRADEDLHYSPFTGEGSFSTPRTLVKIEGFPYDMYLPNTMWDRSFYENKDEYLYIKDILHKKSAKKFISETLNESPEDEAIQDVFNCFNEIRLNHDFEFWAITHGNIESKNGGTIIPFRLNRGQRKLLSKFEAKRVAKKPIRVILCKCRQWGGSTLTQMYMMWIQMRLKKHWHSAICAHVKGASKTIRGMYKTALKEYPEMGIKVSPFEGSENTQIVEPRHCRISVGSAENPDSIRSENISLAHISEFGVWKTTQGKSPEDTLQAITSSVSTSANTLIVIESTAKGLGIFYDMCKKAKEGNSAYEFVFVSWFEIDNYSIEIEDVSAFIKSMTDYEWDLFNEFEDVTLESLNWRRAKSSEYEQEWRFKNEYPATADEAFDVTSRNVFKKDGVARLREFTCDPIFIGEIKANSEKGKSAKTGIRLQTDEKNGPFRIWNYPDKSKPISNRYVVSVDVGGRSYKSDFSVIRVFDRLYMSSGGKPEAIATWRGHIDHDLLAWKGLTIAVYYNYATLVFESNTMEAEETEGSHGEYIFDEVAPEYQERLYCRNSSEVIRSKVPPKWGFNTNKQTKSMVIDNLIAAIRPTESDPNYLGYYEYDSRMCDEMTYYEYKDDGKMGNADGKDKHDDIVMATAIGLFVCYDTKYLPIPTLVENYNIKLKPKMRGASDF